jgi:hypothetical protein
MYKHYFEPYEISYKLGNDTVENYKCKFCSKVLSKHLNLSSLNKTVSSCDSKESKSTLIEIISQEYDCTVYNKSLYKSVIDIKKDIIYKLITYKKKMIVTLLSLYVWIRS